MKITQAGQEHIPVPPAMVWAFLHDPERIAQCLPEVQDIQRRSDREATLSVRVGRGFLKGKLDCQLRLQPDETANRMMITLQGAGLGSQVELQASARLHDPGDGQSQLQWEGEAQLTGPLSKLGGGLIESQITPLIKRTFQNMTRALEQERQRLVGENGPMT